MNRNFIKFASSAVAIFAAVTVVPPLLRAWTPETSGSDSRLAPAMEPLLEAAEQIAGLTSFIGYFGAVILMLIAVFMIFIPTQKELAPVSKRVVNLKGKVGRELTHIPPGMEREYRRLQELSAQLDTIADTVRGAPQAKIRVRDLRDGLRLTGLQRELDALAPEIEMEIKARRLARQELGHS